MVTDSTKEESDVTASKGFGPSWQHGRGRALQLMVAAAYDEGGRKQGQNLLFEVPPLLTYTH